MEFSKKDSKNLEILTWNSANKYIKNVNPELANIIDKLSPGENLKLIKARYFFGDIIISKGALQVYSKDGDLLPISKANIPYDLVKALSYSPIPLTILLNKICEIFILSESNIVPLKIFKPGNIFGIFEVLDRFISVFSPPLWSVSAGNRVIFTLPKISEKGSFNKLKSYYDMKVEPPRILADQWEIYKKICNHAKFEEPWSCEVIFFTDQWFNINNDKHPAWQDFQLYLFKQGWIQRQQTFNKDRLSILWRTFVNAISKKRLNPPPYLIDILRHLLLISLNGGSAIQPMTSNLGAPYKGLQKSLSEVYGLKKYFPTMMHTDTFNCSEACSCYYSLSFPSILEGTPDSKHRSSTLMLDLKDIKTLMDIIISSADKEDDSIFKNIAFSYFHSEIKSNGEIKPSNIIPIEDKRFIGHESGAKEFCSTSSFWHGCIKIHQPSIK